MSSGGDGQKAGDNCVVNGVVAVATKQSKTRTAAARKRKKKNCVTNSNGSNHVAAASVVESNNATDSLDEDIDEFDDEDDVTSDKSKKSRMQTTDAIRVPGLSAEINRQITKFDESEFDVSFPVANLPAFQNESVASHCCFSLSLPRRPG